jgi:hypothetical protein
MDLASPPHEEPPSTSYALAVSASVHTNSGRMYLLHSHPHHVTDMNRVPSLDNQPPSQPDNMPLKANVQTVLVRDLVQAIIAGFTVGFNAGAGESNSLSWPTLAAQLVV